MNIKEIEIYFLMFIIYSMMGWIMETLCKMIENKRFINRGFLLGPYCPIYGTGALLITFLLKKYTHDPIALFIMAIIVCGVLEYLTSYIMEKIFKARWWDYSKRSFNLNGRICLGTIIPFGILGCIIMYVTNPFFIEVLSKIPDFALKICYITLSIIFLADVSISMNIIYGFKGAIENLQKEIKIDSTEEIAKRVKEKITEMSIWYKRLADAYPKRQNFKINIKKIKEKYRQKDKK